MDWNIEKRYITWLLFVVDIFLICIFKCMLCPNAAPEPFEFLYIKCFVIGLHRVEIWWEGFEGDRRCGYVYIVG